MDRNIRGVIFDFDGVILESAEIKTEAFLELFNHYPQHQQAILDYHLEHQGITRYNKFEWIYETLLEKDYTDEIEKNLGEDFSSIVFSKIMEAPFVPGAKNLLQFLKDKNIPSFIASGTPDQELKSIVEGRSIEKYFTEIYGSDLEKEAIIERIMEERDYSNSDLLFVGDAISDYKAASSANTYFIARNTPVMEDFWREKNIEAVENLLDITDLYEFN